MKTLFVAARVALAVFGFSAGLLFLSGCTSGDVPVDNTAMLPDNERVSTVPWNKPQGWESTGALGQLTNDPHFQATH